MPARETAASKTRTNSKKHHDLTEFIRLSVVQDGCKIAPVLAQLTPEQREVYEAAEREPLDTVSNRGLALWLQRYVESPAMKITWQRVVPHRNRTCSCYE